MNKYKILNNVIENKRREDYLNLLNLVKDSTYEKEHPQTLETPFEKFFNDIAKNMKDENET